MKPVAFVIGIACVAAVLGGIFYMQRGDRMDLPGKIIKVRTALLDDGKSDRGQDHPPTSLAVVDFRVTNPSDVIFEVRKVSAQVIGPDGKTYDGQISSDSDAAAVMKALPVQPARVEQWPSGEKYNKTLMVKERIGAHGSQDRMLAASFPIAIDQLDARKNLVVRVEEVDGKTVEYSER
jgi:hypothetical protein